MISAVAGNIFPLAFGSSARLARWRSLAQGFELEAGGASTCSPEGIMWSSS